MIRGLGLADKENNLDNKTKEEQEVIKAIQADLAELARIVMTNDTYKVEATRDTKTDTDISGKGKDKLNARKVKKDTLKIFNQLSSKDAEMKIKLSAQEKGMMKQFVELVDDISNNEGTQLEGKEPVEMRLLNYIKNNPEAARYNTDQEWIDALKAMGLVIKKESWFSRTIKGREGVKDLTNFAKAYLAGADAGLNDPRFSNLTNYVDLIYNEGGLKATLDNLSKTTQNSKEAFKKDRATRFAERLNDAQWASPEGKLNTLFDLNLDGVISAGDVENKS